MNDRRPLNSRISPCLRVSVVILGLLLSPCLRVSVVNAASVRTANFVVTAPSPELAQQAAAVAEESRARLARLWFARELPRWSAPCPLHVRLSAGNGGATSFDFVAGEVINWQMDVQGEPEELLRSTIPHEVNHTLFASVFRQPLPRWLDEGAASSVESPAMRQALDQGLVRYLQTGRGIPFNRLLAARAYPADIAPVYAQGHSLASFLIDHAGHQEFARFTASGLERGWPIALRDHYGYADAGELQTTWLEWVRQGAPPSGVTNVTAYQGACAGGMCFGAGRGGAGWRPALTGPVRPAPRTFAEPQQPIEAPLVPVPPPATPARPAAAPVRGEKGDKGDPGPPGKDAEPVDVEALAAAVEARLEAKLRAAPIRFDLVKPGPDGKPRTTRQTTTLGGPPIELHLEPKKIK